MYQAVKMNSATVQEGTGIHNIIYTVHIERKNILFTAKGVLYANHQAYTK